MAQGFESILAAVHQNDRCLETVVLQRSNANLINNSNTHHVQVHCGDSLMKITCSSSGVWLLFTASVVVQSRIRQDAFFCKKEEGIRLNHKLMH